jgi:hypothetical protein
MHNEEAKAGFLEETSWLHLQRKNYEILKIQAGKTIEDLSVHSAH